MKAKKLCYRIFIILAILLCLAGGIGAYIQLNGLSFSTGQCLMTDSGTCLILLRGDPIVLSNHTGRETPFRDFHTGDTIRVLHDGIQETYPGSTGAYYVRLVKRGSILDIPEAILETLSPMGWHIVDGEGRTREVYTGTVESCTAVYGDEGNFVLKLTVEDFEPQTLTMTLVSATVVDDPGIIQPGESIRVVCAAESSGYREVLSLTRAEP